MFLDAADQMAYIQGERYRVRTNWSAKSKQTGHTAHERDYTYVCSQSGTGVIHYIFRSCRGGWLESFSDLLILLGEIDIRPYRKGRRTCSASTV